MWHVIPEEIRRVTANEVSARYYKVRGTERVMGDYCSDWQCEEQQPGT